MIASHPTNEHLAVESAQDIQLPFCTCEGRESAPGERDRERIQLVFDSGNCVPGSNGYSHVRRDRTNKRLFVAGQPGVQTGGGDQFWA